MVTLCPWSDQSFAVACRAPAEALHKPLTSLGPAALHSKYVDTEFAFQTQRLKFLKQPLEDSGELQMVHFQLQPHNPGHFVFYMNYEF